MCYVLKKEKLNQPSTKFLPQDFVMGLSIILRGSINDRLNWAFNLYDLNKDGCITKEVRRSTTLLLLLWVMGLLEFTQYLITYPPTQNSSELEHLPCIFLCLRYDSIGGFLNIIPKQDK